MNYLLLVLAAVALALSLFASMWTGDVRELREEVQQRQTYINESAHYKQLNEQLIKALANLASSAPDEAIREMLASEGVTFKVNEAAQLTTTGAAQGGDSDDR